MSLLELKALSKACPGGFMIDGISFKMEEKGVYGFFGKSGAGKSLLASMLCGVVDADSGEILYKDNDMRGSDARAAGIRRKIGYVPANCIFPADMTAFEVLDFTGMARKVSPDKRARQIKEALTLTDLEGKAQMLVESLSPSEKKRLGYANALIGNTDVIVIDEPVAEIDASHREAIKKLISMLGKMKVVVAFAKNPSDTEELCNYVGILSDGRLLAFEPTDVLLERLNKSVMAMLRIRENGVLRESVMGELLSIDGISNVRVSTSSGTIVDIALECSSREGIAARVGERIDALGVEVVSLKFASFRIADVVDALSINGAAED